MVGSELLAEENKNRERLQRERERRKREMKVKKRRKKKGGEVELMGEKERRMRNIK